MIRGQCVKVYEEKKKWSDAQRRCGADGGHLYYFKTLDTAEPVINDVTGTLAAPTGRYWVGASQTQMATYRWGDGTLLALNTSVWMSGEPSDTGGNEECMEVVTEDLNDIWFDKTASPLSRLNDFTCDTVSHFICQVDV
ncbi:C-type lectin domain family 4 member G-like [Littorina saxatilis]